MILNKNCKQCNKEFTTYLSQNHKFCSKKCYGKWVSENRTGKNGFHWKGGKITLICKYCSNEYEVIPSLKNTSKFCSIECRGKWESINRCGENNPSWQGGLSYGKYCEKFNESLREEIRNKYNRKCFICNKSEDQNGRKLSVHHIDRNKSQGCDSEWELVPLCMNCHARSHNDIWEYRLKYLIGKL